MVNKCWPFRQQIISCKICIMKKMHIFGYKKKHFLIHTKICALDYNSWSLYQRKWKLWHPSWLSERFRMKFQVWDQNFQQFQFLVDNMVKNAQFFRKKMKILKILISNLKFHSESFRKSCDIVIKNYDLVHRSSYVSENAFSCIQIYAFFQLCIFCEV